MIIIFIPFFLFAGVIENNITAVYKNTFKDIKIDKIILKYYGSKPKHIEYIDTSTINPKNNRGFIKINNSKFIYYTLIAKIKALKSTKIINKNDIIDTNNAKLTYVPLKNIYKMPLTKMPKNSSAKFYIPSNKIIYDYMISNKNLIKRNSPINVITKSGGIEMSFRATALENGKSGDIIKVKDENNKIYKVKIDKNGNGIL